MSQGDGSNRLKREPSILSYFGRVSSEKSKSTATVGFVSAKQVKTQPNTPLRAATVPSSTIKPNPFATVQSATKHISNDSKYTSSELYGDQKLVFSSQLTAKRILSTPISTYTSELSYIPTTPKPTITATRPQPSASNRLVASPTPTANEARQKPTPRPSPASRHPSLNSFRPQNSTAAVPHTARPFQAPANNNTGFSPRPYQPTIAPPVNTPQRSMFGNPNLGASLAPIASQKKKRTFPAEFLVEPTKHRASSYQPGSYTFKPIGDYTLSSEQEAILRMALFEGKSLFFTGSAGTGKSILLRELIAQMQRKYHNGIAVTASTGIAACNIGGLTLHSFAGIGIGIDSTEKLVKKIKAAKVLWNRWQSTKVLIIDEISMIDDVLFDKIESIARQIRNTSKPFGGIQVILTGDFFQLPPVGKDKVAKFCFESSSWNRVIEQNVMLTHVFRQKDEEFVRMLNEMRLNDMSPRTIEKFRSLSRTPSYADSSIEPTRLYSLRNQVDAANNDRLQHLKGPIHRYTASDWGDASKLNGCMAPTELELKLDAQVMLIKNLTPNLVNGSTGIVVGFTNEGKFMNESMINDRLLEKERPNGTSRLDTLPQILPTDVYPIVRFVNGQEIVISPEKWEVEQPDGKTIATRTQIPLMLAWALSIHKSQGQTLDRVFVDLGTVFEKGQAYVALSRATDINSLQVLNFNPSKVVADHRVIAFYRQLSCCV